MRSKNPRRSTIKIHEYQGRELLTEYGITIPQAIIVESPEQARSAADSMGGSVVVKAQVLAGGRGKAGGIRVVSSPQEAELVAQEMLAMEIKGCAVKKLLVAEKVEIQQELYSGITIDRDTKSVILIISNVGGVEIEETAEKEN